MVSNAYLSKSSPNVSSSGRKSSSSIRYVAALYCGELLSAKGSDPDTSLANCSTNSPNRRVDGALDGASVVGPMVGELVGGSGTGGAVTGAAVGVPVGLGVGCGVGATKVRSSFSGQSQSSKKSGIKIAAMASNPTTMMPQQMQRKLRLALCSSLSLESSPFEAPIMRSSPALGPDTYAPPPPPYRRPSSGSSPYPSKTISSSSPFGY
mmetsp:Transcript_17873/g.50658  ORF Transcript_17873/g.50658 Transcript_17873/m.50658 type:complete len:208 (+) Transcript_17873:810-1433(+)